MRLLVTKVWVLNALPTIILAKTGYADLLLKLCSEVLVPDAVAEEMMAGPYGDTARIMIEKNTFVRRSPTSIPGALLEWGLGTGETNVLALALERMPATAILDDGAARACARTLGIPVTGTLGIILRAKRMGYLHSAADALRAIHAAGLYLDDATARAALESAGETWQW